MVTGDPAGSPSDRRSILEESPKGVGDFLVALALAAHRYAMYPPDHPSLRSALETSVREIGRVLADRGSLAVSARGGRLLADSVVSDESHVLFSDLARRMEEHQLGSLVFRKGVTVDEMSGVLSVLSRDPHRPDSAVGLLPLQERPTWEHALLQPLGYEFLHPERASGGSSGRSIGDFRAELARRLGVPDGGGDGSELAARLIRATEPEGSEEALDGSELAGVVMLLARMLHELGWDRETRATEVRRELESMILAVPPAVVGELLSRASNAGGTDPAAGGDFSPAARLLVRLSRADLAPAAVARLCSGLSMADDPLVSPALAAVMERLAESGAGSTTDPAAFEAAAALRAVLEQTMVRGAAGRRGVAPGRWLDAATDVIPDYSTDQPPLSPEEARRVIALCLEVDREGPALERALRCMVRSGRVAGVIERADAAPSESRAARAIEDFLVTPSHLRIILSGDDVDDASLTSMVNRLGDRALDPLFDRLAGSESRTIRRKIFDCLTAMGERVSATAMAYLADPPWFVQRNMLALLQRMPTLPTGFSPLQHLSHEDERVRREALPLALRVPGARIEALRLALRDEDERIVRMALLELQDGLPDEVISALVESGLHSERFPELRSLAARALGRSRHDDARAALISVCRPTPEKPRDGVPDGLGRPGPVLLSALVSLAESWPDHPEVEPILEEARRSTDPRIRAAALGRVTAERDPRPDEAAAPSARGDR